MRRESIASGVLALIALISAAGCATDPKQTVMNLDTTDRKWTSRECVSARKAVYEFNDHHNLGTAVSAVGNLLVPFAGTGASIALTGEQQRERETLNHRVLHACVSDRQKIAEIEAHDKHGVTAALQH
jgi:hypothetical protein